MLAQLDMDLVFRLHEICTCTPMGLGMYRDSTNIQMFVVQYSTMNVTVYAVKPYAEISFDFSHCHCEHIVASLLNHICCIRWVLRITGKKNTKLNFWAFWLHTSPESPEITEHQKGEEKNKRQSAKIFLVSFIFAHIAIVMVILFFLC